MITCYFCGEEVEEPRECIICKEEFCDEHVKRFEIGNDEHTREDVYTYVCFECLDAIEKIKGKPKSEWTEEDKVKIKGMTWTILKTWGKLGIVLVTLLFGFAFWLLKKILLKAEEGVLEEGEIPTFG